MGLFRYSYFMYQTIHEDIIMAGVYSQSKFAPKKFEWKKKIYQVDQVTLVADIKDGGVKKRLFSLVSSGEVYRIFFDRESEKWWLEEKWVE